MIFPQLLQDFLNFKKEKEKEKKLKYKKYKV